MKTAVAFMTVAGMVGAASANFFTEIESNNTLGTANNVGTFGVPGGSVLIDGSIDIGDVDWFSFSLSDTASLAVFSAFSSSSPADGVLQIVDSNGVVIGFDDDSGVGLMPALQLVNLSAGQYFVGISGFGDQGAGSVGTTDVFDGLGHQQSFVYKLTIGATVVPAPASAAMLGLGGLVMARRRR